MSSRLRRFLWPAVVILFAIAAYAGVQYDRGEFVDFAVPYRAATRFLAHEPLYQVDDGHYQFKYLPAFAAVMVPFTVAPKAVAEAIWFALIVAMAWAFVRLAFRALPARRMAMAPLIWLTLLLNGENFVKELAFGQFNLPLGLLLLGAIVAAQHGRGLLAGGLIAAGVFIKPYALLLVPWLVLTQGWRPLAVFAGGLVAGLALPMVSYGWDGNVALLRDWYHTVSETTAPNLMQRETVGFASMWARWIGPGLMASQFATLTSIAAVAIGLVPIAKRKLVAAPAYLEGAYFFTLIPIVSPQGWDYVMILALPAYMLLVDRWRDMTLAWRAVTLIGFLFTSFGIYDVWGRSLYFFLMDAGAGTIGAVLMAASLVRLRWRAQA